VKSTFRVATSDWSAGNFAEIGWNFSGQRKLSRLSQ
jgi:hypothetical protein